MAWALLAAPGSAGSGAGEGLFSIYTKEQFLPNYSCCCCSVWVGESRVGAGHAGLGLHRLVPRNYRTAGAVVAAAKRSVCHLDCLEKQSCHACPGVGGCTTARWYLD